MAIVRNAQPLLLQSGAQVGVLKAMLDGPLIAYPGHGARVGSHSVQPRTVNAMVKRGWIVADAGTVYSVTPEGRAALAEAEAALAVMEAARAVRVPGAGPSPVAAVPGAGLATCPKCNNPFVLMTGRHLACPEYLGGCAWTGSVIDEPRKVQHAIEDDIPAQCPIDATRCQRRRDGTGGCAKWFLPGIRERCALSPKRRTESWPQTFGKFVLLPLAAALLVALAPALDPDHDGVYEFGGSEIAEPVAG